MGTYITRGYNVLLSISYLFITLNHFILLSLSNLTLLQFDSRKTASDVPNIHTLKLSIFY